MEKSRQLLDGLGRWAWCNLMFDNGQMHHIGERQSLWVLLGLPQKLALESMVLNFFCLCNKHWNKST